MKNVNDRIHALARLIDTDTSLHARDTSSLLLLGDSFFLRQVQRKATALGISADITSRIDRPYQAAVVDTETARGNIKLPACADIDCCNRPGLSAVAEAVLILLNDQNLIAGKEITIIGRGHATQGLADILLRRDATVTVGHSKSPNILKLTDRQDVVIYATPVLEQDVWHNTKGMVIDLGGVISDPLQFECAYVSKIGDLTTSVLLNRFVHWK